MVQYGFHHLHLKSKDPDAVAKFLVDNFGGELVSRNPEPGPFLRVRVRVGGQMVLVNGSVPEEGYEGGMPERRFGMDHWGLSVNDLDAAYQELTAKGVQFAEPPRAFGAVRIAFVLTPDNVRVELVEVK